MILDSLRALVPLLLGVGALLAAYLSITSSTRNPPPGSHHRPIEGRQRVAFVIGCLVLLLALGPPLENWAGVLISAHVAQDILLMFVVPPLLLYGSPGWLLEPLLKVPGITRTGYLLTRPAIILALVSTVTIVWHLPQVYDAAQREAPLHLLQHFFVLATSLLIWWPLFGSIAAWPRPSPLVQCLIFFALTFPGAVVGSMLVMGKPGVYASSSLASRPWGIGLQMDQQFAGLTLWVGAAAIYLLLLSLVFFRWANHEEANERRVPASRDAT